MENQHYLTEIQNRHIIVQIYKSAEVVRFELTIGCPMTVFKTVALNHSATLP